MSIMPENNGSSTELNPAPAGTQPQSSEDLRAQRKQLMDRMGDMEIFADDKARQLLRSAMDGLNSANAEMPGALQSAIDAANAAVQAVKDEESKKAAEKGMNLIVSAAETASLGTMPLPPLFAGQRDQREGMPLPPLSA